MSKADPIILQLQQDLLALGIDPGPVDGLPGSKTRGAAHTAAQRLGLKDFTGKEIPPNLIEQIKAAAEIERQEIEFPPHFLDVSEDAAPGWREGYRPLSDVEGIVLHQTGCPLPEVPQHEVSYYLKGGELSQIYTPSLCRWAKQWVNSDQDGKRIYSALKTHLGITYAGRILKIHPWEQWGWSAQSGSKNFINIELAGLFCGVEGDISTRPGAPASWKIQSVTPAQIEAAKSLIRFLVRYFRARGARMWFLGGHRQFTWDRDPDPGSKAWQEIVLPLHEELGLSDGGEGWVRGKGHKIPREWNPAYSASY